MISISNHGVDERIHLGSAVFFFQSGRKTEMLISFNPHGIKLSLKLNGPSGVMVIT